MILVHTRRLKMRSKAHFQRFVTLIFLFSNAGEWIKPEKARIFPSGTWPTATPLCLPSRNTGKAWLVLYCIVFLGIRTAKRLTKKTKEQYKCHQTQCSKVLYWLCTNFKWRSQRSLKRRDIRNATRLLDYFIYNDAYSNTPLYTSYTGWTCVCDTFLFAYRLVSLAGGNPGSTAPL